MLLIYSSNLSWSSYVTPRSRTSLTFGTLNPAMKYWIFGLFLPMCKIEHLLLLMPNCQVFNQRTRQASPGSNVADAPISITEYNLTSSANNLQTFEASNNSTKSLINKIKRSGPSPLPWITPLRTEMKYDQIIQMFDYVYVMFFISKTNQPTDEPQLQ